MVSHWMWRAILGSAAAFVLVATHPVTSHADPGAEKSAFEVAKELGTEDAWNAFLNSYPSGFYADMARAYIKKGSAETQPPPVQTSSSRVGESACAELASLRSQHSNEPTKITFNNVSGMYRSISWVDFEGNLQQYGGLNPGEQISFDTFRTHPWVILTGPGDCLQIFLPAAEAATVNLVRLAADDPSQKQAPQVREVAPVKQQPQPKKTALKCAKNYKLVKGECVLQQNCGANAYRSAEGDCYCKKGYQMRKGKCVWPKDK